MDNRQNSEDILHGCNKMPYSVPEGYFESFSERLAMRSARRSPLRRLAPYLSLAAMFAVIALVGTAVLKRFSPADDMEEYEKFMYSEFLLMTEPEEIYYSYNSDMSEISEEDIVNYLIHSGVSPENLE